MAEPRDRHTADDGGKFYLHPTRVNIDSTPARYLSVTTVLDLLAKPGLKYWAAKGSSRRAMENLPKLIKAARIDPCGNTWKRDDARPEGPSRCGKCYECVCRWVEQWHHAKSEDRKREGSAIHDVVEHWSKFGTFPSHDEAIAPYVERLKQWIEDYGLKPESWEAIEMTVWSHLHRYAGTLDAILRIEPTTKKAAELCARIAGLPLRPVLVVLDVKSREGEGKALYTEHSLQLAPYRHAETATVKGAAIEVPMPRTDGAVVFQPRPDGYTFEPVASDERVLNAFLGLLKAYRPIKEDGPGWILVNTFPVPSGFAWSPPGEPTAGPVPATPSRRAAAPRKTATATRPTTPATPPAGGTGGRTLAQRIGAASLDEVTATGQRRMPGATLTDDDIPF